MSSKPICSACGAPIDGEVLTAFEMTWHPYHLVCKICNKDFSDGSACCEGPDGFAYCEADFNETFSVVCCACNTPIEDQPKVEALGKVWHQQCFKCPMCDKPFETLSFVPGEDGQPYCEKHYYQKAGLLCTACQMPITSGKRIMMGDKPFHAEHFCCTNCKKHLAGLTYKRRNDKPYCVRCANQLFQ